MSDNSKIEDKLDKLIDILLKSNKSLNLLVKAAEVELAELKYDSGLLNLQYASSASTIPDIENTTPSNGGYVLINVYETLLRPSPEIYLQNEGPGEIRSRIKKHNGHISESEDVVYEGETKEFYDVHDIRLRTTTANTKYRLTEYKPTKHRDFTYKTGLSYVNETNVAVAGVPNTENIVTHATKGLGRSATTGYVINDGPGNLQVEVSIDGTNYGTVITLIVNQILEFEEEVYSLRIDATINGTSYRMNVH